MQLSIVIPALNEAEHIQATLLPLQALRDRQHEVILVDGGSNDNTIELAGGLVDRLIQTDTGRAQQMNAGAAQAQGDVLWFLHSDSQTPAHADTLINQQLIKHGRSWGRFNIRLSGRAYLFRIIERMMNLRSCISGIATGDQGIFVKRDSFNQVQGYPTIALMEDIALSRQLLRSFGRPGCIKTPLTTSSRRWEQQGIVKTILLMWRLRLAYFLGASPDTLAQQYTKNTCYTPKQN